MKNIFKIFLFGNASRPHARVHLWRNGIQDTPDWRFVVHTRSRIRISSSPIFAVCRGYRGNDFLFLFFFNFNISLMWFCCFQRTMRWLNTSQGEILNENYKWFNHGDSYDLIMSTEIEIKMSAIVFFPTAKSNSSEISLKLISFSLHTLLL